MYPSLLPIEQPTLVKTVDVADYCCCCSAPTFKNFFKTPWNEFLKQLAASSCCSRSVMAIFNIPTYQHHLNFWNPHQQHHFFKLSRSSSSLISCHHPLHLHHDPFTFVSIIITITIFVIIISFLYHPYYTSTKHTSTITQYQRNQITKTIKKELTFYQLLNHTTPHHTTLPDTTRQHEPQ